jgi:hypothetical protein
MIKNVLTHIGGVGVYGVISILIFMAVFVGVGIWMMCLKKSYYDSMKTLPLDDDAHPKKNPDLNPNSN